MGERNLGIDTKVLEYSICYSGRVREAGVLYAAEISIDRSTAPKLLIRLLGENLVVLIFEAGEWIINRIHENKSRRYRNNKS